MEYTEEYKEKIQSMQKFVPLLSKLIAQLEDKTENTPESLAKINQLKILQNQLCDPKPGILLEELNKCEQVLENLFELHEKREVDETETAPEVEESKDESAQCEATSNNNEKEIVVETDEPAHHTPKILLVDTHKVASAGNLCSSPQDVEQDLCKSSTNSKNYEMHTIPQIQEDDNKQNMQTITESTENATDFDEHKCIKTTSISNIVQKHKEPQGVEPNLNSQRTSVEVNIECTNKYQTEEAPFKENATTFDEPNEATNISNIVKKDEEPQGVHPNLNNQRTVEEVNIKCTNKNQTEEAPFTDEGTFQSIEKQKAPELKNLNESLEEGNVELIEFSENGSEDEGELIVPDEENIVIEKANKKEETGKKTEPKDEFTSTEDLDEINSQEKNAIEELKDENVTSPKQFEQANIIEEHDNEENTKIDTIQYNTHLKAVEAEIPNEPCQAETKRTKETVLQNTESVEPQEVNLQASNEAHRVQNIKVQSEREKQKTKIDEIEHKQNGEKRSANEQTDDSIAKRQKLLDSDSDSEEFRLDPLSLNNETIALSPSQESDNDDVEIIEQRNSPILIESDEDVKIIELPQKPERKTRAFAFKSTNPNKILNKNKTTGNHLIKSQSNIANRNIPPKPVPLRTNTSQIISSHNPQTNFLSNIDLQPSQHNPRHFKTNVGKKTLLIPNAFYGSPSHNQTVSEKNPPSSNLVSTHPSNACSDAAHCQWLDNFLHHFCSPRNTAHNTSYLILKRALRQDDFERICRQRSAMSPKETEMNVRLLSQLRNIFYVDGNHTKQKLTFVGRKLCKLAFVNILDKTISLTTDSITNEVTARTRISVAAINAARDMCPSSSLLENADLSGEDMFNQSLQMNTFSKTDSSILSSSLQSFSTFRKRREDDSEYCPPREINHMSTESPPRRSLRTSARQKSTSENVKSFTYNEVDDEENFLNTDANNPEQPKREKPSVTPATKAYITQKRLAAKQEQEKLAKSFETAFIETISRNAKSLVSGQLKAPTNLNSNNVSPSTSIQNNSEVFVISDDDDDVQEMPSAELTEPRLHLIHKASGSANTKEGGTTSRLYKNITRMDNTDKNKLNTNTPQENSENAFPVPIQNNSNDMLKNNSAEIHSMSSYNSYCLICKGPLSRVVGHYVNSHPESEVFISRPSPEMAQALLNNTLTPAAYDRLQNGLSLYIATCVFCEKKGSFTLPYWYQHFASHTGEYAYQCTGCGLRKPTRSQLSLHVRQNCPKNGNMEVTYQYDLSSLKINGFTCRLCNYTQLNMANMLKHFKYQHNMDSIEKSDLVNVALLEIPKSVAKGKRLNNTSNKAQNTSFYVHVANNEVFEIAELDDDDHAGNDYEVPVVINEADVSDNWYGNNMTANMPYMDFEVKNDEL